MKEKVCVFLVKIIAEIFGPDDILVDKIKFAEMVEERNATQAFKKVQKRIKQKAARRGYHNGYRFHYLLYSPFKKIWEKNSLN